MDSRPQLGRNTRPLGSPDVDRCIPSRPARPHPRPRSRLAGLRGLAPSLLLSLASGSIASGCVAPTSAGTTGVEALPLGDDAESCGGCHTEHAAEHDGSAHARSRDSPVFVAMLPEVEAAWGADARRRCESCHAPGHSSDEGVGCVSCHAAVGNHAERDGMLAIDASRPLAGRLADPEPNAAHRSAPRDFLVSASLCGTCHELTGPRLAVEPTLSEHRASPQAAAGLSCADCHMPAVNERPLSEGATRTRRATDHRFVGFDPPWGAGPDVAREAAERTRALLASALRLDLRRVEEGVEVTVTNVGAGHAVPTGAAALRELWVDLEVEGAVVAPRVIELGDQPMAGEREVPLLVDADHVARGALQAGESRRALARLAAGPLVARLRGRAVRAEVLARLGLDALGPEVPTHEIAEARE